ncbi:MAG: hypothetical protein ABJ013_09995 [Halioglobus sp.]
MPTRIWPDEGYLNPSIARTRMKRFASWCLNLFIAFNASYPMFKPTVMRFLRISHETELKVIRFAMQHGLIGNLDDSARLHKIKMSGETSLNRERKITDADYFDLKLLEKVSSTYGLEVDFGVIQRIRQTNQLPYLPYADDIESAVSYVYLSLLFRYPSSREIEHHRKAAEKSASFDALFQAILNMPEYNSRGYQRLEQ